MEGFVMSQMQLNETMGNSIKELVGQVDNMEIHNKMRGSIMIFGFQFIPNQPQNINFDEKTRF